MGESAVEEFFDCFRKQKLELRKAQEERHRRAQQRHKSLQRFKTKDKKAEHPREWNPSIKVVANELPFEPFEPNPDGKPFDFENRDIWPVMKGRSGQDPSKVRTPWYSVRSGELFNHVGPMDPTTRQEQRPKSLQELNKPPFYVYTQSGRLFSPIEFSPTFTTEHAEALKKFQHRYDFERKDE